MSFQWPPSQLSSESNRKAQRQLILESIAQAKSGHPGGSLSMVELLSVIFETYFNHRMDEPEWSERDRFVLSKGHGVPALYAIYSALCFFDPNEMKKLRNYGHFLQGHPDRLRYSLMEASTGSLGQGISVALGLAMGLKLSFQQKEISRLPRVYCLMGDGEMQEGQVWEALMAAGKYKPGNLTFILDYNKGQIDGHVREVMDLEPIADKVKAFGLKTLEIDGHDLSQIDKTLSEIQIQESAAPTFIIAHTVKGKGVSFMEDNIKWHGSAPNPEELIKALDEVLGAGQRPFGSILEGV